MVLYKRTGRTKKACAAAKVECDIFLKRYWMLSCLDIPITRSKNQSVTKTTTSMSSYGTGAVAGRNWGGLTRPFKGLF
jgi:uncharacterized membrane protein